MRSIVLLPLLLLAVACSAKQSISTPENENPDFEPDYDPRRVSVPFLVDDHYIPSGCMGDCPKTVSIDGNCPERGAPDAQGECHHFTFAANPEPTAAGWAGVLWQTSEKNWGSLPGREIEPGATRVCFYIAGAVGGEKLDILVGAMAPNDEGQECEADADCASGKCQDLLCTAPHRDTLNVNRSLELSQKFEPVVIDFGDRSYGKEVLSGFGWTTKAAADGSTIEFFVDDVRWE